MKRNVKLRVKLKSLAEEARIIRLEERRANHHKDYELQNSLAMHRKFTVRGEARSSLLAYQYLRGVPYHVCECPSKDNPPDWEAVASMVRRFGGKGETANARGGLTLWSSKKIPVELSA